MRFAHLYPKPGAAPALYVEQQQHFIPLQALGAPYANLKELISAGRGKIDEISAALQNLTLPVNGAVPIAAASHAPAVTDPPIVLAVGLNYDEHAAELSLDNDSGPVLFSLFPNSLNAHQGIVPLPTRLSSEVDYEGELGVVIGRAAKDVPVAEALNYVFGYTIINDITARNIQFQEPQWSRCKSFDGFTPIGPVVVTADEIPDPQTLSITTEVNGLRVQDSTTGCMIRSVAQLISTISQSLTLLPGTVISTGSPGGAGRSRKPPLYLQHESEVSVTIQNIGTLTSHCVA